MSKTLRVNDFLKKRIEELNDKISSLETMTGRNSIMELRIVSAKKVKQFNVELLNFCNNKKGIS